MVSANEREFFNRDGKCLSEVQEGFVQRKTKFPSLFFKEKLMLTAIALDQVQSGFERSSSEVWERLH